MGIKNPILPNEIYFLTSTVVDWVDVFTRPVYKDIIVNSLKFCQNKKGLDLYAWCLMTNHIHWIAGAKEGFLLSDIIRDFKKFTSTAIVKAISEEAESRRDWMLYRFGFAGKFRNDVINFKFWQDGNEPKDCRTREFTLQKLNYIHQNPVRAGIVFEAEQYMYSSAINYMGGKGLLDVILLD
jgi:putative transposase